MVNIRSTTWISTLDLGEIMRNAIVYNGHNLSGDAMKNRTKPSSANFLIDRICIVSGVINLAFTTGLFPSDTHRLRTARSTYRCNIEFLSFLGAYVGCTGKYSAFYQFAMGQDRG